MYLCSRSWDLQSSQLQFCSCAHQGFCSHWNFCTVVQFLWNRYSRALFWANGICERRTSHFFLQMSSNRSFSPKLRSSLWFIKRSTISVPYWDEILILKQRLTGTSSGLPEASVRMLVLSWPERLEKPWQLRPCTKDFTLVGTLYPK